MDKKTKFIIVNNFFRGLGIFAIGYFAWSIIELLRDTPTANSSFYNGIILINIMVVLAYIVDTLEERWKI